MQITKHALEQYLFKVCGNSNMKAISEPKREQVQKSMERQIAEGEEIELTIKEATIRLINNHAQPATYIYNNEVLFVLVEGHVVTCYPFPKNRIHKRKKK
jgi:hypothetical protein